MRIVENSTRLNLGITEQIKISDFKVKGNLINLSDSSSILNLSSTKKHTVKNQYKCSS